jgi:hypothetical protein
MIDLCLEKRGNAKLNLDKLRSAICQRNIELV